MDHIIQEPGDSIDMEHVADSAMDDIQPGKIVKGEIVTIDNEFAYVNVGTKVDGRVPLNEFEDNPKIGDNIDVVLHTKNFVDGMYQFSKLAAETEKRWSQFIDEYQDGNQIIEGKIESATNKGKIINCKGLKVFLPFSLAADLRSLSKSDEEYTFKIKTIDEKKKSIIISRKDYLDEENSKKWGIFSEQYNVGDKIPGTVLKFVEFGAFIRVAGIDALLHRNDMTWKKIFKQRKLLKLNEEREFIILDINKEHGKISLGLKQLIEDPWLTIENSFNVNDVVNGKVVTITNYGAFVEIADGVEGFVSNSDLSWTKNTAKFGDMFEKNDETNFVITEINKEERKLSLGYKQLQENPWDTIDEKVSVGSILNTKIKKIVKFGMFVELQDDIDGLVHLSDISWNENVKDFSTKYKEGSEIEVKILEIKKGEKKISCGIKQLQKSPWELISEKYPPRTKVDGVISGITPFGLFIKLEDDVEGLVHISEVSRKKIEDLEEHFKVGEKVSVIILGVDVDKKRLSLSIKHFEIISEKEELDRIMKDTSPSTVTLGDIINIKLEK